jgi:hypothetical protein
MKFQDRIDKIINYPANLKEAKDNNTGLLHFDYETLWIAPVDAGSLGTLNFYFSNPNYKENLIFFESDIFRYPSREVIPTASDADTVKTKVWEKVDNIANLEGYFIGYELDTKRVNFASLLNTPEFSIQFFNDLNPTGGVIDTSFYYLLHAMPLNPPVPILATAQKQVTSETFEPNPAILFKNNAGVYSLPDPYIWWLGGIWKNRVYKLPTIVQPKYITFEGDPDTGWKSVDFAIGGVNNQYSDYFIPFNFPKILGRDKINTLVVSTNKFAKSKPEYSEDWVSINIGTYSDIQQTYGIDSLNGIGNYDELFNRVHNAIYGTLLPTDTDQTLINWNMEDKLRTFPTYSYDLSYTKALTLYATYSVCNYTGISDIAGELSSLVKILDTSDDNAKKSSFNLYSSIWDYIFYHLTSGDGTPYAVISDKLIEYYTDVFTDQQIWAIEAELFKVNPITPDDKSPIYTYDSSNELEYENNLFLGVEEIAKFIDLIGLQVLQFIAAAKPVDEIDLTNYYVQDSSFTCILYPSAGGVAGLQYVLSSLSRSLVKGTDNGFDIDEYILFNRDDSNEFSATIMNIILNSSRYVWGSGPFVGDATYNMDALIKTENFNVIGSNLLLSTLDTDFLYDNSIHTKKANRTYILDSGRLHTSRINSLLRYNAVIDYIGLGALETFQGKYDEVVDSKDKLSASKNILLSLLVVDKSNFSELTVDGNKYTIDEQIHFLVKYSAWLTDGFVSGKGFIKAGSNKSAVNICKVMNASLTQAQTNKINYVIKTLTGQRSLFNVGSVFDFGEVESGGIKVTNMFDRALANKALDEADNGKFIRLALFGTQTLPAYADTDTYDDYLGLKYYYRYGMSEDDTFYWALYFFERIDVAPIEVTMKIAKDLMMLYFKLNSASYREDEQMVGSFDRMATIVRGWLTDSDKHITACLTSAIKNLNDGEKAIVEEKMKDFAEGSKDDINLMKQKSYYNIKSLFDNWISVSSDKKKLQLQYSYTHFTSPNSIPEKSDSLISHFLFVDRANRDVGHNMLANIEWLKSYFENNFGYKGVNTDISLYTFLSDLAKQHASLIHALPSFINFGVYQTGEGNDSARDLFGTFDYVDIAESNPKFLFQFIGNTNTILNTAQNKNLRSASKSYSLLSSHGNTKSNISSNIGNGVNIPRDLMQDGASAMAFVVDFGEQHQQIFSNLQLDQSEYQNTEEWYKGITQYAKNRTQTQGGDLFSLFTERSYTAQVDSLGNMMIQPLMFFELTNIPLFYGTYWITNVKHSITPNDIKTTFKGVRQPMAVLPSKNDVLLQLSDSNISSLLGVTAINQSSVTNNTVSSSGSAASSGNVVILSNKALKEILISAGYAENTVQFQLALAIGTKEGWSSKGRGTRSYRNNNPGNLDYSNSLKTIDPNVTLESGSDPRFAKFTTAELGAKALIENKIRRWSIGKMPVTAGNTSLLPAADSPWKKGTPPTIAQFFYTYAPPNENDTEAYIKHIILSLSKVVQNVTRFTVLLNILK